MTAGVESTRLLPDTVKWSIAAIVTGGALVGFYVFSDHSLLLRVVLLLVALGISTAIASQTVGGRTALGFARDARIEVRKVVWPTRKETVQTTMIILVAVCIVASFLWLIDAGLAVAMRVLLGTGA